MKVVLLAALIFLIPFSSIPYLEQTNAQIEPLPPSVPNPEPEPIPIPKKEPEPIQEPFPGLTDAEKLEKLTKDVFSCGVIRFWYLDYSIESSWS